MVDEQFRRQIVKRILGVYPGARKILLFGSRAAGTSVPESDYDLLVVTRSNLPPAKRAARLHMALRDLDCPFDILVVTPEEYRKNLEWKSSVIHAAASHGEPLYEVA